MSLSLDGCAAYDPGEEGYFIKDVCPVSRGGGGFAICFKEDEAFQICVVCICICTCILICWCGRCSLSVLFDRVLGGERARGGVPGERVEVGSGEEVDVGIDDGDHFQSFSLRYTYLCLLKRGGCK